MWIKLIYCFQNQSWSLLNLLKLSMSGVELEMLVDSLATNNTEYKETKENLDAKKIKNKFEAALVERKL